MLKTNTLKALKSIRNNKTFKMKEVNIMSQNNQLEDLKVKKTKLNQEPPRVYKVIILNDDYSPMEFVINVIQKVFKKDFDNATKIMLQIHNEGLGVCGIYSLEIAETKMSQVLNLAKESQHPLQCLIEKI